MSYYTVLGRPAFYPIRPSYPHSYFPGGLPQLYLGPYPPPGQPPAPTYASPYLPAGAYPPYGAPNYYYTPLYG